MVVLHTKKINNICAKFRKESLPDVMKNFEGFSND